MTDKKTRAPRQMTVEQITKQIDAQPLENKLAIGKHVDASIAAEKERLTKQIELINGKP